MSLAFLFILDKYLASLLTAWVMRSACCIIASTWGGGRGGDDAVDFLTNFQYGVSSWRLKEHMRMINIRKFGVYIDWKWRFELLLHMVEVEQEQSHAVVGNEGYLVFVLIIKEWRSTEYSHHERGEGKRFGSFSWRLFKRNHYVVFLIWSWKTNHLFVHLTFHEGVTVRTVILFRLSIKVTK